jgi:putative surface-exposed virulence protein
VTAGLQTLWYETAGSWNERTWLVRSQLAGNATRSGWSLWSKAYGGWINRDSTNTLNVVNTAVSYDTTYWQSYYGIQFGGDYLVRNGSNGAWMIGLLGGYNRSDVDFDGSVDGLHYTVYNAGGYVSYMNGPVFADLLVKDDFARVNLDLPSFAGITHPNANSLGGEFTVGARFGGGASGAIVIEPMGTVSYVNTTVDAVDWPGMSFNWQNGTSFRGTLGVKLSADFGQGQNAVQPFIMGGFGDEFKGDNQLSVTSGGNAFMINDKPIQTFATASFGLNFSDAAGWSGFIRGDGLFASNYTSGAIRVGVRDRF